MHVCGSTADDHRCPRGRADILYSPRNEEGGGGGGGPGVPGKEEGEDSQKDQRGERQEKNERGDSSIVLDT